MTFTIAIHIRQPDGNVRREIASGNTTRTVRAAANAVARMERADGNEVALSLPRRERD